MATRRKSKTKGLFIMALCGLAGAWFHEPILDQAHKWGIAKKHN